jgi:hypothetical protein
VDDGGQRDEEAELPEVCDLCCVVIANGSECYAIAPDSSVIHAGDPKLDGQRVLSACSPHHLGELQQQYRQRPFVNEEQWAGKIRRAMADHPLGLSQEQLIEATGLNLLQIERAVAWERERRESSMNGGESPSRPPER